MEVLKLSTRFSRRLFLFKQNKLRFQRCYSKEMVPDDMDNEAKAIHVEMLSKQEDDYVIIQKFSETGFTLSSGVKLFGACAFFPRNFLSWKVNSIKEVTEDSMALFTMLAPKPDLLILGVGSKTEKVDGRVIKVLREKKINFEILPTEQAIATFNFLNSEHRWIAAALIPPNFISDEKQEELEKIIAAKQSQADYLSDDEDDIGLITDGNKRPEEQIPETNMFGYKILRSPLERDVLPISSVKEFFAGKPRTAKSVSDKVKPKSETKQLEDKTGKDKE